MPDCRRRYLIAGWRSDNKRMIEVAHGVAALAGWPNNTGATRNLFVPIGSIGFLRRAARRRASTSNPSRPAQPFPPVSRLYELTHELHLA